jgi:2-dehydro-3-deoxyphosphooctonate aldolase (KDO 8-P synthase)
MSFDQIPCDFAILGPCVVENQEHALKMAAAVISSTQGSGFTPIYKSSYEKANRSSIKSYTGLGMEEGLEVLSEVKRSFGIPVTTDVHESVQVDSVAQVVDILQIPAFLCRQSALLRACAETQRIINVKKAQFLSGYEMAHVVEKLRNFGAQEVILTERGTMFGYNNLVVDFRNLSIMRSLGVKVCMDATHSVQLPGALAGSSGGQRRFVPLLARAAAISGVDGFFMETHDDPDNAPSDGPNMVPIEHLRPLLSQLGHLTTQRKNLDALPFEDL